MVYKHAIRRWKRAHATVIDFRNQLMSSAFGRECMLSMERHHGVKPENIANDCSILVSVLKNGIDLFLSEDFHFTSLHNEIEPLILMRMPEEYQFMCFRISSQRMNDTIRTIRKSWDKYAPEYPFEFHFLDQSLEGLYTLEQRYVTLVRIFSVLAILISCLGLLGMVSFLLEHRTKEIGIRKVLGASVSGIVLLFTKEFVKWVAVANGIAWPLAYMAMNRWLQSYPYRTPIYWWIFALSGGMALFIALITIGSQVVKAAAANPVESLRYE